MTFFLYVQNVFWGFAFSTLTLLLVAFSFIIFFVCYQSKLKRLYVANNELHKELLTLMVSSQEEERKQVADDLNDHIGQLLSSAGLYLDNVLIHDERLNFEQLQSIAGSRKLIDDAIRHIRRVSYDLVPYFMNHTGLQGVLQNMLWRSLKDIHVQWSVQLSADDSLLSEGKQLIVFRIIKELITKIIISSKPTFIQIHQIEDHEFFILKIKHDGIEPVQQGSGLLNDDRDSGLKKMMGQLEVSDGEMTFTKNNNNYTAVLKVPYDRKFVGQKQLRRV